MTNSVVKRYRIWQKYRRTYNELMQLDNRELADLGISRIDIPAIARNCARR